MIKSTPLRVLAGLGTMGMSEAGGLIPARDAVEKAIMPDVPLPEIPAAPSAETGGVQAAVSAVAQRRSRARSFRSTILSQQLMNPNAPALQETLGS